MNDRSRFAHGMEHLRWIEDRLSSPGETTFVAEDAHGESRDVVLPQPRQRDGKRVMSYTRQLKLRPSRSRIVRCPAS